jgi:hypothetical protein
MGVRCEVTSGPSRRDNRRSVHRPRPVPGLRGDQLPPWGNGNVFAHEFVSLLNLFSRDGSDHSRMLFGSSNASIPNVPNSRQTCENLNPPQVPMPGSLHPKLNFTPISHGVDSARNGAPDACIDFVGLQEPEASLPGLSPMFNPVVKSSRLEPRRQTISEFALDRRYRSLSRMYDKAVSTRLMSKLVDL